MSVAEHPWTKPVRLDEIPEAGRRLRLAADEPVRAAVARAAGVRGLTRLVAVFDLTRAGRDAVRVVGRVAATVHQTCVVTLEPIENDVDEPVEVAFAAGRPDAPDAGEIEIIAGAPEPPEPLIDRVIDLGAIATEFLNLGIDPYPRKPGAVFEAPADIDAGPNPFAALEVLKRPDRDIEP